MSIELDTRPGSIDDPIEHAVASYLLDGVDFIDIVTQLNSLYPDRDDREATYSRLRRRIRQEVLAVADLAPLKRAAIRAAGATSFTLLARDARRTSAPTGHETSVLLE